MWRDVATFGVRVLSVGACWLPPTHHKQRIRSQRFLLPGTGEGLVAPPQMNRAVNRMVFRIGRHLVAKCRASGRSDG